MENIFGCDVPRSKGRKQGLINTRLIIYILGVLVLVEAGLFALCAGVSLLYEEPDYIYFVQTMGINIALGGSMVLVGKRTDNLISRRDGYCIVSVSWLLFTALGMLPFYGSSGKWSDKVSIERKKTAEHFVYLNNHNQIYNNEQQFSISCMGALQP